MIMPNDDHDHPKYRGGTIGDRFADAGHADRPERRDLQGPSKDRRGGCPLFAMAVLTAVAVLVVPFLPLRSKFREGNRS